MVVNQDFSYNESIRRSFAEDIKGRTDSGGFLFDREHAELKMLYEDSA